LLRVETKVLEVGDKKVKATIICSEMENEKGFAGIIKIYCY
jgi:hypothetical protein